MKKGQCQVSAFILPLLLLVPNPLWAHKDGLGTHIVEAHRIEDIPPPKIDGRLDDLAWQSTRFVRGFTQLTPDRGQPATDDTAFAIAYDRNHLYVGFRCYDAAPDKIINRITRRGNVYESDVISFFLDPHHDHRTGYKFATTPGGVQSDAYRYNDAQSDSSWQGIWWVETQRDELGWAAEFKIPFANFRFTAREEPVWGFDVERVNRRKNEVTVWKQMSQSGAVTRMADLGHLARVRDIEAGKQFEISPYFLGGLSKGDNEKSVSEQDEGVEHQLGTGLDIQYNLTESFKTNLTVNPDFAQVEADQLEINLTRFPTRFPEKRPFFIEGNSFFETPLDLFFSRRIGSRGDILWGAKTTGKVGDYSIGLLGSQTGSFDALGVSQPSEHKEAVLYSAIRLKKDILKRSNIGFIVANKEHINDDNQGDHSRVGGVDANLLFHKTYRLSAQYGRSFHPGPDTKNGAYLIEFGQRNYLWNATVGVERIDPLFETNQTGFLQKEMYRGVQGVNVEAAYTPQLGSHQFFFEGHGSGHQGLYTEAYFTNWKEKNPNSTLSPEFEEDLIACEGDLSAGVKFTESFFDVLGAHYRRAREVELTDVFTSNGYGFFVETNSARPASVGVMGELGDFYNFARQATGKKRQLSLFSTLRPQSNFTTVLSGSYAQSLDREAGINGRFFVSSLRITYLFTRDAFLRVFTQVGREQIFSDKIHTQKNYLVSVLFGWEYSPKSHIFVAYNEDWITDEEELRLDDRVFVIKMSYLWNL